MLEFIKEFFQANKIKELEAEITELRKNPQTVYVDNFSYVCKDTKMGPEVAKMMKHALMQEFKPLLKDNVLKSISGFDWNDIEQSRRYMPVLRYADSHERGVSAAEIIFPELHYRFEFVNH